MAEESNKQGPSGGWTPPSNSKLEADIAYFEARLSMLDEKPTTSYQNAQVRAYTALESLLNETLERIRSQQRKRRKMIRAKSDFALEALEQTDLHLLLQDSEERPAEPLPAADQVIPQRPPEEVYPAVAVAAAETGTAVEGIPSPATVEEQVVEGEVAAEEIAQKVVEGEVAAEEIAQVAEAEPIASTPTPSEILEQEESGDLFDSDNYYLRHALFSENLSLLQNPEEVEDEWGDIGEAEIAANLGGLDLEVDPDLLEESLIYSQSAPPTPAEQPPDPTPLPAELQEPPHQTSTGEEGEEGEESDSFFDSWLKE